MPVGAIDISIYAYTHISCLGPMNWNLFVFQD